LPEDFKHDHYSMTDIQTQKLNVPLEARIEAILFVAPAPVSIAQLEDTLEVPAREIEVGLQRLELSLKNGRGLRLQCHEKRYQLTTAPEFSAEIERYLGLEVTSRLSRAALETLAIIAYRQPVTRPGVDAIRGVNSDGVIKSLLSKGLIQEVGRAEGPGRPILYGTTQDFLQHFGLSSLEELPPFESLESDLSTVEEQDLLKD
jgi:segregation and condensation protein B